MRTLVFDIETVGEDFNSLDPVTQSSLTRWIKKETDEDDYGRALEDLKNGLGFSPLTGEIVAVGVYDLENARGAVYFGGQGSGDFEEENFKFRQMPENQMLSEFWNVASHYSRFVTYNGRSFDVPFLMIRSAIHAIRPSKNLLSNRFLNSQLDGARHIDLQDQLTFYGAMRRKGSLHLFANAFGIKSPKSEGVTGDDVAKLYREKKFVEIAKYNSRDLVATAALYERWDRYLNLG